MTYSNNFDAHPVRKQRRFDRRSNGFTQIIRNTVEFISGDFTRQVMVALNLSSRATRAFVFGQAAFNAADFLRDALVLPPAGELEKSR